MDDNDRLAEKMLRDDRTLLDEAMRESRRLMLPAEKHLAAMPCPEFLCTRLAEKDV